MKTSSAKAKGRNLQKWVRDKLLEIYPLLTKDDIRSTSMGSAGEDILLSSVARIELPYTIECKSRNCISVYKWLEQGADSVYTSIVFAKGNHKEPIVIMYAEDFFKLLKEKSETKKIDND